MDMSPSSGEQRWSIQRDGQWWKVVSGDWGVDVSPPESAAIEVMPVSEHERLMKNRCTCVVTCGDRPEDEGGTCKLLPRGVEEQWVLEDE